MPSFKAFADFQKMAQEKVSESAASRPAAELARPEHSSNVPVAAEEASSALPARPASREKEELRVGLPVRVKGLQARPELNGLEAVITSFDEARSRWQVELKNGGGAKLFKAANLEHHISDQDAFDILKGRSSGQQAPARETASAVPAQAPAAPQEAKRDAAPVEQPGQKSFLARQNFSDAKAPSAAAVAAAAAVAKGQTAAKPGETAKAAPAQDDEDDDEAFVKSIEQCLKECDVMWDDY